MVINHTTGERFELTVESEATATTAVTVTGQTVSWPDDSWYEVQSASTYETICTGGRNCVVPKGTYNVINHSSGERFEGIQVGSATSAPTPMSSPTDITAELPKSGSIPADGRWSEGRSSPWEFNTQWFDTNGNWLHIDSQVQGPLGVPNSRREATTTSAGAQWAANYSDTQLQILILGPEGRAYPTASIFLDTDNSKSAQYDVDVQLTWGFRPAGGERVEYSFGWADGVTAERAVPANMGTMILLSE